MHPFLAYLSALILILLPGAWIAFTLADRSWSLKTTACLSIILSPFVVAVQIIALAALNVSFSAACIYLIPLNLIPLAFIVRRVIVARRLAQPERRNFLPAACFLILAAVVIFPWTFRPDFRRTYSWQNMMQTSACYQIARLPAIPEETDLAGTRLNYSWFGLVHLTCIATLIDKPPTTVFPVLNLLMLLATFGLLTAALQELLPTARTAALVVALIAIITNLPAVLLFETTRRDYLTGDNRIQFLDTFTNIDAMTIAIPILTAQILLLIRSTRQAIPRIWALGPILLLAAALCYPLLLPGSLVLTAVQALVLFRKRPNIPNPSRSTLLRYLICSAAALAIAATYIRFPRPATDSHTLTLANLSNILRHLYAVFICFGLWFFILLLSRFRAKANSDPATLPLMIATLAAIVLFILVVLPTHLEYQSMFVAMLCLIPLTGIIILPWLDRQKLPIKAAAAILLVALASLRGYLTLHEWNTYPYWQTMQTTAIPLNESSFHLTPLPDSDISWLDTLRATPPDTILADIPSTLPISTLADRSLFVYLEEPANMIPPRLGYAQTMQMLSEIKDYPQAEIVRRTQLLQQCFSPKPSDFAALTASLTALHRPIAIHFPIQSPYLLWLKSHAIGRTLDDWSTETLWLLPARN